MIGTETYLPEPVKVVSGYGDDTTVVIGHAD